jgi:ATP-binding cassette subfamily B protein
VARNKYDVDEELVAGFNFKHLLRMFEYLKPYKFKVMLTVFLMLTASAAALLNPYLMKVAIDSSIPNSDIKQLIFLSSIFVLTLIINAVCLKFRIRTMTDIGQSVIVNIRKDLFVHLQKLPFSYYDSRPHGKILVRVVNYVNSLSDLLSNGLINLITDMFTLVFILCFMFFINVNLTLICMAGLPILMGSIFLVKNAQRKAWQKVSRKQSNMNAYIHESICGIKVTQSFAREEVNRGIFGDLTAEYKDSWMHAVRIQFLLWPMIDTISVAGVAAVFVAGISWLDKGITVGVLIAFISYIWRFWEPITNLGNFYNSIVNATAYLERIFEAMDEKPLVDNIPEASEMSPIRGNVEFKNVNFSYEEGEKILKDVSFKVNTGDTIALVGPTGAGKTTIVNLLSRFYNIDDGQVLVDGVDISKVTLESLRKQMGVMMQDTFIFSGTIMDNIRYSKLDASDDQVVAAARAVKAHDFIIGLENGYETEVNERGTRLSVGQRQLISFARALLADPRILILDEATSSIDTKTEMALQKGLERLLKGRTSFIIAHRLSTIKNATRIMYIDGGRIVEQGTHDELMELKGAYYMLYTEQYRLLDAI